MTPRRILILAVLALAALAATYGASKRYWSFTVDNRTYDGRFFRVDVQRSFMTKEDQSFLLSSLRQA